jgi:hypothetical protein
MTDSGPADLVTEAFEAQRKLASMHLPDPA